MDRFTKGQIVYIANPTKLQYHTEDTFGEHLAVVLRRGLVFKFEYEARKLAKAMINIKDVEDVEDD